MGGVQFQHQNALICRMWGVWDGPSWRLETTTKFFLFVCFPQGIMARWAVVKSMVRQLFRKNKMWGDRISGRGKGNGKEIQIQPETEHLKSR